MQVGHSSRLMLAAGWIGLAAAATPGQPVITSLGSGTPTAVSTPVAGTLVIAGGGINGAQAGRWTFAAGALSGVNIGGAGGGPMSADGSVQAGLFANTSPQIQGNTATSVAPPFSTTPTLVASSASPATTEFASRRWVASSGTWQSLGGLPVVPELMVYGSGSSGSSTGSFLTANAVSATGRFVVGLGYVSTYSSSAGTAIGASTFQWRPWIYDAAANGGLGAITVLPTPARTTSNTWRRRTGNAYAVSADGRVIVGAQEHNVAAAAVADPDGGRPVVWRLNTGTNQYEMTFLPNGVDAGGFPYTYSTTPGTFFINQAGTVVVGKAAADLTGQLFIAKWTWNAGTSTWSAPVNLGSNLSTPATWLPSSVTSCAVPPSLTPTGMSDDGNTVVGTVAYSTCSSFMSGGFIWRASDGLIQDWYDFLVAQGTAGVSTDYAPIGDLGDPSKGLPRLGFPAAISSDGTVIAGFQGGTQRIPGAVPWVVRMNGGSACTAASITQQPADVTYSRCSFGSTSSSVTLSVAAAGTLPLSYQWYKGAAALADGPTGAGSTVSGATGAVLRITTPVPGDAGVYHCVVTGCNGAPVGSANANVQVDTGVTPPANDTCTTATSVGEGTANFNICGAFVNDGGSICLGTSPEVADVWYRYVPTFTGEARFQTCASGFDTTLQLLDGCNGSVLACNNDAGARGLVGVSCSSTRSVISRFPVTAGVPVYVRVGAITTPTSNGGTTGALTISQAPAAPANDSCSTPTDVGVGTWPFDLSEATEDIDYGTDFCTSPSAGATASNRDVWFRLVSPCGGTYTISTCGSAISNPMLHVMTDCSFANVIACNDNVGSGVTGCTSSQARILDLTIGSSVLIRVSASGTSVPSSGVGQLVITGTPVPCTGACCSGSTCSAVSQSACAGANTRFAGANTVCNAAGNNTSPCCKADYNQSGAVTVQDIFDFLAGYFTQSPSADINGVGGVSVQDIFDFLGAYFAGCN